MFWLRVLQAWQSRFPARKGAARMSSIFEKKLTPRERPRRRWPIVLGIIVVLLLLLALFTDIGKDAAFIAHFVTPPNHFTYKGHSDYISSVAWSPDGKRIASVSTIGQRVPAICRVPHLHRVVSTRCRCGTRQMAGTC